MTKSPILLIFREGFDANVILSKLNPNEKHVRVILERGGKAKAAKLRRMFRKIACWQYPVQAANIIALVCYSELMLKRMQTILKKSYNPSPPAVTHWDVVDDINDQECIDKIAALHPQLIFIYGTAIVRKNFFQQIKVPVLNIHSGIVPKYRNVHSDFWAYSSKDYHNIGISLLHLDAGIDSGDIALQRRIEYRGGDTLAEVKVKNLQLIAPLIEEATRLFRRNQLPRIKQLVKDASHYPSPTATDLFRFFVLHSGAK